MFWCTKNLDRKSVNSLYNFVSNNERKMAFSNKDKIKKLFKIKMHWNDLFLFWMIDNSPESLKQKIDLIAALYDSDFH